MARPWPGAPNGISGRRPGNLGRRTPDRPEKGAYLAKSATAPQLVRDAAFYSTCILKRPREALAENRCS
uniref:Uncharacterized protein n=1 Tax=Steinernema glaseri TaxID=37863 RepID=A0A1I7YT46_9BILA